jgi:hypothetical protein
MCQHRYVFGSPNGASSIGICHCGAKIEGLNGFPDNAYDYGNEFNLQSNPKRQMDNDVERILNDKRYPHIFDRNFK